MATWRTGAYSREDQSPEAQVQRDIRDLLLIVAGALTGQDRLDHDETRQSFLAFLKRRRDL